MCKRLCYLISFAMVMGLVLTSAAQGADPNLVAWWRLDEGAGDVAVDSSGNGYNGTLTNAQWVAPGWDASGSCVELDRDGHVDLGNPDALNFGNVDWTITAWINTTITGTDETQRGTIFANGGDWGGGVRFTLCVAELQDGMVTLTCDDDSTKVQATGTTAVNDGEWRFVVGQREGTTIRVYTDAVAEGENTVPATYNLAGTSQHNAYLGAITDHRDASLKKTYAGLLDDVRIFNRALSADELVLVMMDAGDPELAANPSPEDKATDIPRDTALSWTAGEFAATHDVYLGTTLDDVNNADRANPLGVLVSEGQADTIYAPPAVLEYGQTYYWRIDEVNAAPDNTIFRGELWSFTVEPLAYEIEGVVATSNAVSDEGVGPERTVDGSGLNENDQHSTAAGDMWLGKSAGADPVHLQYEFDRVYKMHELLVWNYNVEFEPVLGFGLKDVTVEYSADGAEWVVLGDVEFAQATAKADYTANTAVDLAGVAAKFIRLTVNSNHGVLPQYGLSEVRFLQIPTSAREPQPASGAADVSVDSVLSWRAGRDAAAHDVYFAAGQDELALVDTVADSTFAPGELTFGTAYTWRIDEVNEAEATPVWEGDVWTFVAQEYAVIDDFESYDDEDNRIYDAWLDGLVNSNGATVGYFEAPFAEQSIVNSGAQSMPLEYDNSVAPFYSEAEYDLGSMDLTANGADTLRLFVAGQADNTPERLYVALEDTTGNVAVVAHPDANVTATSTWTGWQIPYAELSGVNLGRAAVMYIGVGDRDNPTAGGTGLIFIDDIGFGHPAATE